MSEDPVLCYCMGVTRDDVRRHFVDPTATLDQLVERTNLTRKCTACLVDLDLLLDEIQASQRASATLGPSRNVVAEMGLRERIDRVDSGFFLNGDGVRSAIRLANYPPIGGSDDHCVAHDWKLRIYAEDGRCVAHASGRVAVRAEATIDISGMREAPAEGWFLLRQIPRGPGHYGTLRPQLLLQGARWAAAYHTQFHADASRRGRRAGAPVFAVEGRTRAQISIINGSRRPTDYEVTIDGLGLVERHRGALAGNGAAIVDLDRLLPAMTGSGALIVRVESAEPTRKNLINRHPD
ncbi:MAG: hypothetical protein FJX57_01380, partial [Alphaproteobacteria bacterium]|nr:hypothetical protein [Alphaproteobacteria bacterium]